MEPSPRVRTLTSEGKVLFEYYLNKHTEGLMKCRKQLEQTMADVHSTSKQISSVFERYEKLSDDFTDFLKRSRSEESFTQLTSHRIVFNAMETKKNLAIQQRMHESLYPKIDAHKSKTSQSDHARSLPESLYHHDKPLHVNKHTSSLHMSHRSRSSKQMSVYSHDSRSSRSNRHSDISSKYLREKMKAEVAKVRFRFAEQEALIEKEQALKQVELKVIQSEKEYVEAQAKLDVMDEYMNDTDLLSRLSISDEEMSPRMKVEQYLRSQDSIEPATPHHIKTPPVDRKVKAHGVSSVSTANEIPSPHATTRAWEPDTSELVPPPLPPVFQDDEPASEPVNPELASSMVYETPVRQHMNFDSTPSGLPDSTKAQQVNRKTCVTASREPIVAQQVCTTESQHQNLNQLTELSQFLMKKELMLHRLSTFNDKAETYLVWKATFKNVTDDLQVNPKEEIDLIIKYLGPESRRQAESLYIANATNPELALIKIWSRLEDRYASPELIEQSLRQKLSTFGKISNNDRKRLFDLSDLLGEILSVKEQEKYRNLMAYYDSSAGVNPIVMKLPTYLQNKWTEHASKYKKANDVMFPPFDIFVNFINVHAVRANDPSFDYSSKAEMRPTGQLEREKKSSVTLHPTRVLNTRKTDVVGNSAPEPTKNCPLHNTRHNLNDCKAFQRKPIEERRKFMRDKGVCFRCCAVNEHIAKDCMLPVIPCQKCGSKKHCTALHVPEHEVISATLVKESGVTDTDRVKSSCMSLQCTQFSGRSCAKIVLLKVNKKSSPELFKMAYAIIDDQSNHSLATTEFFSVFSEYGPETEYVLSTCAGTFTSSGRRASEYVAESIDGEFKIELPPLIECNDIPKDYNEIPTSEIASHYSHLKDIARFIPPLNGEAAIMLLIGRDAIEAHQVIDQVVGPKNTPFAQRLKLGWVIIGKLCNGALHQSEVVNVNKTKLTNTGRPTLFDPCDNYFKTTKLPAQEDPLFERTIEDDTLGLSFDDHQFLDLMNKEMTRNEAGNWEAPLPLRSDRQRLPNNKNAVMKRAMSLAANLQKNPQKRVHFVSFMDKILQRGHAEIAPEISDSKEIWYLPIFGVYHPKKPEQIRVVFDSSARCYGVSLNDVLLKGPDLYNSLLGILLRFRSEAVACMTDIQQMFHCFFVRDEDRDFLRFLWHKDNDPTKEIVEYRMRVHTFGNSPSPAIATYGLRRAVLSVKEEFGDDVCDFVLNNFYVDDGLLSTPDTKTTADVLRRTQQALQKGGNLRLHKISSNSPELMKSFPSEDLAESLKEINLQVDDPPLQRSLGIYWNVSTDTFTCRISSENKPFTMRGVLSTIGSLYDPLGLLAPVINRGKMFFRKIMNLNKGWDDPLSSELEREWTQWKTSLKELETLNIPRCYGSGLFNKDKRELHVFSDASTEAIAAVAFLRTVDKDGRIEVSFVLGKAKLTPTGGHTIPRLELCAAVLATQLKDTILSNLEVEIDEVRMYTDSRIVLGYIYNSSRRFYVYVGNMVQKIRNSTEPSQWRYVNTDCNPADEGTRFLSTSKLDESVWLKGPQFLYVESTDLPEQPSYFQLLDPESDKDVRPEVQVAKNDAVLERLSTVVERFEKFSEWNTLVRAASYLIHLARSFKKPTTECKGWHQCDKHKEPVFKQEVERFIIQQVQNEVYCKEIDSLQQKKKLPSDSPILSLALYLDNHGLLRVGGRMNKLKGSPQYCSLNPIIIPGKTHLGTLLVRHYHGKVYHQGRHLTEGAVRAAGYWLVGGRRVISSCIHSCIPCRKLRGVVLPQKMADLPIARISPSPPFTHVGVDVFGPWQILTRKTRGGVANSKRWAALFTCLSTRAVHIEVLEDMSSSSFINALRRFTSIRGDVDTFYSDRGTNFVGATDPLKIDAVNVEDLPIKEFLYRSGVCWKFNSPHSSHMGGVWERMIGVARRILDAMLLDSKNKSLTHDVLSTLMYEVMAIINSRPIVQVSSDPECPEILSPSVLLTQKTGEPHEPFSDLDVKDLYRSQSAAVQYLANTFWSRFMKEYVNNLQVRKKWQQTAENLKIGDIVLLKDVNAHRRMWPIGRIINIFPGDDGLVRKVQVKIIRKNESTTLIRPISELVLLLSE